MALSISNSSSGCINPEGRRETTGKEPDWNELWLQASLKAEEPLGFVFSFILTTVQVFFKVDFGSTETDYISLLNFHTFT